MIKLVSLQASPSLLQLQRDWEGGCRPRPVHQETAEPQEEDQAVWGAVWEGEELQGGLQAWEEEQHSNRISYLKKLQFVTLSGQFEMEWEHMHFVLQPSHSDKAANAKVLKWMTELTKLRKQIKGNSFTLFVFKTDWNPYDPEESGRRCLVSEASYNMRYYQITITKKAKFFSALGIRV